MAAARATLEYPCDPGGSTAGRTEIAGVLLARCRGRRLRGSRSPVCRLERVGDLDRRGRVPT